MVGCRHASAEPTLPAKQPKFRRQYMRSAAATDDDLRLQSAGRHHLPFALQTQLHWRFDLRRIRLDEVDRFDRSSRRQHKRHAAERDHTNDGAVGPSARRQPTARYSAATYSKHVCVDRLHDDAHGERDKLFRLSGAGLEVHQHARLL